MLPAKVTGTDVPPSWVLKFLKKPPARLSLCEAHDTLQNCHFTYKREAAGRVWVRGTQNLPVLAVPPAPATCFASLKAGVRSGCGASGHIVPYMHRHLPEAGCLDLALLYRAYIDRYPAQRWLVRRPSPHGGCDPPAF